MTQQDQSLSQLSRRKRFFRHVTSRRFEKHLAFFLAFAFLISAVATFFAFQEIPPLGNDPHTIIWLLNLDFIILLFLIVFIVRKVVRVWSGRKRGIAGSHLHVRMIYTFSLFATVPVVVMTLFSVFFYYFGVQAWFSERVSTAINESRAVAEAYLEEHKQAIRADTLAMANDLNRLNTMLFGSNEDLEQVLRDQSFVRNLSEAIVFDETGRVVARSGLTFTLELEEIPRFAMSRAKDGEVVIVTGTSDDRVRALVKLNTFQTNYLFAGRMIDPEVLQHLSATTKASKDYETIQSRYANLQISATIIFVMIGFILLLCAIWFGLILARQLVDPIIEMMSASDRVRAGDMTARVETKGNLQEFDYLANSFNRMTAQIEQQRNDLISANRQLDLRRRLTESILKGVSAGVLGLDIDGTITTANTSASKLLNIESDQISERNIQNVMPQSTALLKKAHENPDKPVQGEIAFDMGKGTKRMFLVRVVIEKMGGKEVGAVLTFDDITELQSAQRKAAWADVARRIAHEIKNPLTPIQLSAERLKRKYLKQISEDPEIFEACTDTIVKHVDDIGRMVSEFSDFARMPEPVKKQLNLKDKVKETLTLYEQAHSHIKFELKNSLKKTELEIQADAQMIRQAVSNLLQNAVDAIIETKNPKITCLLIHDNQQNLACVVYDNGQGFPEIESIDRLSEPYVTQKEKGTGLGLAIVKKIMEDHDGKLILGVPDWLLEVKNYKGKDGACAVLLFTNPNNQG